jgi:hypothetical protein
MVAIEQPRAMAIAAVRIQVRDDKAFSELPPKAARQNHRNDPRKKQEPKAIRACG